MKRPILFILLAISIALTACTSDDDFATGKRQCSSFGKGITIRFE